MTRIRVSYDDGTGYSEWTYNSSNLTAFGGMTLTYDATGRLAEVTGFAAGAFV